MQLPEAHQPHGFGVRWDPDCLKELKDIVGTDEAVERIASGMEWRLAQDPYHPESTWELSSSTEDERLTYRKPTAMEPVIYFSYIIVDDGPTHRYCLMRHARRGNLPEHS